MKRVLSLLSVLIIALSLVGCEKKTAYNFLHDESEISAIEIVEVPESDEQTVVAAVSDREKFLDDFKEISCYLIYGDPKSISANSQVIKITYKNGDCELIDAGGQSKYTDGRYKHYAGYRYFDSEAFAALLSEYSK